MKKVKCQEKKNIKIERVSLYSTVHDSYSHDVEESKYCHRIHHSMLALIYKYASHFISQNLEIKFYSELI